MDDTSLVFDLILYYRKVIWFPDKKLKVMSLKIWTAINLEPLFKYSKTETIEQNNSLSAEILSYGYQIFKSNIKNNVIDTTLYKTKEVHGDNSNNFFFVCMSQ